MGQLRARAWSRAVVATAVAALFVLAPLAAPAGATARQTEITDWSITAYKVDLNLQKDGDLLVAEQITVNFYGSAHHGIERFIQDRFAYDDVKPGYDRLTPIRDLTVSGSAGTPVQVKQTGPGNYENYRIGDPDKKITGEHTYTIRYRMLGTVNHFSDHDELFFNPVGNKWAVPIDNISVTLTMPAPIQKTACYAGPQDSRLPCDRAGVLGNQAAYGQAHLAEHQGVTVVASIAPGVISPAPKPIVEQRWTIQNAFSLRPDTVGPAGAILAVVVVGFGYLLWRKGRDQQYLGGAAEQSFGNVDGGSRRAPLMGKDPIPVEFAPPDDLRPGQVGTLIDEQANTRDVTATIIDLAVRGYLRITEIPKKGLFGHTDWTLTQLKSDDGLKEYERTLLSGLFAAHQEVELSDLKDHFHSTLVRVEEQMYDDTVRHGWFSKRPDKTRSRWKAIGWLLIILGIGATVALAALTTFAVVGVPIILLGLLVLVGGRHMPSRTAKGHAAYRRVLGFKQFIDESEKERAQFAERKNLFSEYLPYAVVFGATKKWARAFAGLEGEDTGLPETNWYVSQHPFTIASFGHAMDSFATTTAGTLASVPASSGSSGFSGGGGGGFGGGGGGAW